MQSVSSVWERATWEHSLESPEPSSRKLLGNILFRLQRQYIVLELLPGKKITWLDVISKCLWFFETVRRPLVSHDATAEKKKATLLRALSKLSHFSRFLHIMFHAFLKLFNLNGLFSTLQTHFAETLQFVFCTAGTTYENTAFVVALLFNCRAG